MKALVIIPTFDHGELIRFAIESVLSQTHQNFELAVISDAAPETTRSIVAEYQARDARIKLHAFPKGPRLGEAYRHEVILKSDADFVAYLADDDIYLSTHLAALAGELENVDFTHALPVKLLPSGQAYVWQVDLALEWYRNLLLSGKNRIPLGCAGHRMDFYRKLPEGWRTTPEKIPTDLYMWQQFLAQPGIRCSSLTEPGLLHFSSQDRQEMTAAERSSELKKYSEVARDSQQLAMLKQEILSARLRAGIEFECLTGKRVAELEQGLIYRNEKYKTETTGLKARIEKQEEKLQLLSSKVEELKTELADSNAVLSHFQSR